MRQIPQCCGMRLVVWMLVLCLWSGTSAGWGQAQPPAKKSAHAKKTQPAPPAATSAQPATPAPAPPPEPLDPLGRTTPYGCVLGFLRAAEEKDYAKAAKYLDGKRSDKEGEELAIQLKALLDVGLNNLDSLSHSPEGNTEEDLRVSRERVGVVKTSRGEMDIFLDQVKRPDTPPIWLFSQETLRQVPEAYASMQHKDYGKYFPEWAKRLHFLSMPLWRWFLVVLGSLAVLALASLLTRLLVWLLRGLFRRRLTPRVEEGILRLKGPIFGLTVALALHLSSEKAITALARHYWEMAAIVATWISCGWMLARLTDIFLAYRRSRLLLQLQVSRVTLIGLMGRFFKILILVILAVGLLRAAGVDITAVMTGLGIGGIALALAAQSTLADMFGGLSVVMRGAVRVGDFCQIDGVTGNVEDIGVSSLSLRTLDRSVVSIPNSKVAQVKLENFEMRDQFWLHQVFTLRFDTPYKVVKIVLDRFAEVLAANPEIDRKSARVRLINLTASGPQIEVFAYFRRPGADWAVFLEEQEKIILKMMSIVEAEGTSFAAPIGVVQMGREKKEEASVDSGKATV